MNKNDIFRCPHCNFYTQKMNAKINHIIGDKYIYLCSRCNEPTGIKLKKNEIEYFKRKEVIK